MTTLTKDTRLHIRCDQEVRHLLDKTAAYEQMSVSEFVLRHAVEQARSAVQQHESITLSEQDFVAFLDALDAPPKPSPALQRAFTHHADQVSRARRCWLSSGVLRISKKPEVDDKPLSRSFASHDELMADMRNFRQEFTASPSLALDFLKRAGLVTADGKPKQLIRA